MTHQHKIQLESLSVMIMALHIIKPWYAGYSHIGGRKHSA